MKQTNLQDFTRLKVRAWKNAIESDVLLFRVTFVMVSAYFLRPYTVPFLFIYYLFFPSVREEGGVIATLTVDSPILPAGSKTGVPPLPLFVRVESYLERHCPIHNAQ